MTERWDDFMHYPRICTPRASHRKIEGFPPRNLGEARGRHIWIWAACAHEVCRAMLSMPLAPLIIRFGEDALLETLADSMRCSRCGP